MYGIWKMEHKREHVKWTRIIMFKVTFFSKFLNFQQQQELRTNQPLTYNHMYKKTYYHILRYVYLLFKFIAHTYNIIRHK